jgi:hypothetical protein
MKNYEQRQHDVLTARGFYKDGIVVAERPLSKKGTADVLIVFLEKPRIDTRKGNATAVWKALSKSKGNWKDGSGRSSVRKLRNDSEKRRAKLKW